MKDTVGSGFRFLIVGGVSTVIELTVFNLLFLLAGWDPVLAKIAATGVALINAYLGNRFWAFRSRASRRRLSEILLFLAVNLFCMALGALLLGLGTSLLSEPDPLWVNVINLATIAAVVVVRFALYRWLVFTGQSTRASAEATLTETLTP